VTIKSLVCLEKLWTKESNWRPKAKNKLSTAYGIPQLLKMKETNPYKQIDLGLRYIDKRYKGSPCKALAHHKEKGWY
jgi:resuscitation-promoting factor RpfB